jgi:hypothetical protein
VLVTRHPGRTDGRPTLPVLNHFGNVSVRPVPNRSDAMFRHVRRFLPVVFAVALTSACAGAVEAVTPATQKHAATPTSAAAARVASVPAQCAKDGSYVWSHKEACGWPGAQNTGYRLSSCPGRHLVASTGSASRTIHVTTPNTVVSCEDITGCLSIDAPNVTLRDVEIACTSGRTGTAANGTSVINISDGASAVISHVEINGMQGVHACVWHQGTSAAITAMDCHGVNDGVFSWADKGYSSTTGDHITIANSYFHDFTTRTGNGHIDGYQTEGAAYGVIQHNTYLMTSDDGNSTDSAIAVWDSLRSSHDFTVRHNLIAGGGFGIYAEDYSPSEANPTGEYAVTSIQFIGNVFSQYLFGCVGYLGVWYPRGTPSDGWRRTGNRILESGASVDNGNPTYNGRSCS